MKIKDILTYLKTARATNTITGLFGAVAILSALMIGVDKTISTVVLSIGTSVLASAIVSRLNSRYLIQQSIAVQTFEKWGLEQVY